MGFAVASGSLLHVHGPNGSGKTSLLRVLCGLSALASGQIRLAQAADALRWFGLDGHWRLPCKVLSQGQHPGSRSRASVSRLLPRSGVFNRWWNCYARREVLDEPGLRDDKLFKPAPALVQAAQPDGVF